jgi:hypothetical protein
MRLFGSKEYLFSLLFLLRTSLIKPFVKITLSASKLNPFFAKPFIWQWLAAHHQLD